MCERGGRKVRLRTLSSYSPHTTSFVLCLIEINTPRFFVTALFYFNANKEQKGTGNIGVMCGLFNLMNKHKASRGLFN